MKQLGLVGCVIAMVLFTACGGEEEGQPFTPHHSDKPAEVTTFSTDFNENTFSGNEEIELLKELKLCDPNAPNDTDENHPSCSPKFFRFFKLSEKTKLSNGFILLVKAGVNGFPLRRVLIFQRDGEQLVKLNGFNGNLIEFRPSKTGYQDLVVRFSDNIDGSLTYYNCLFQWNGSQYDYKLCEAIQEGGQEAPHRIKQEFIDSMAPEIKKVLDENKMLF
ncbi:MAG: hypothetical protein QE487_13465 [Fluviicola sp.]|nr:hypothetical protein [Fluviicola sp.]